MYGQLPPAILPFVVFSALSAAVGVSLSGTSPVSRRIVPLSGAILIVISLFWILPELVELHGWTFAAGVLALAFGAIVLVDRFVYPVCPACAPHHDHEACSTRLHGFAVPTLTALALHNLFDGWALALGELSTRHSHALSWSVVIHKLPECLAAGVLLRAAMKSRTVALSWAIGMQLMVLLGAFLGLSMSAVLSPTAAGVLLAFGGGTFLYLGFHALHGEWKRRIATRPIQIS